ncbi:helix-turn-helix domain-containing protein [Labilibaculum euxinus]|uniref:Helix-turn-helix domain-containing protein n=1 Tax=Labilibaculum euxinus TaxID=2686357 RepID=A0A7M4D9Y7_9BACT|nr:helix-turn-helix domain-containing protein [Labilibaculum euxinus]MUP39466.1 helix-turn-helix domain-containing protein [Labilibaculum euxinus]MVB08671.1 helix-turn-helix domain-containing protein [Labilibaculum euxinus]
MEKREDLNEFYNRIKYKPDQELVLSRPHINVFERSACTGPLTYSRRDYYKITLILGEGRLDYADKSIYIDRPALLFSNPLIPYNWQNISKEQTGWFCIFNEFFVKQRDELLTDLPMFQLGHDKVYFPDENAVKEIADLYRKMMVENEGSYIHKQDVLRNYLHLIVHYALRMEPAKNYEQTQNAATRITSLFMELLERQFPIDSMQNQLRLKSANDYACQLSVHTNHLNRAVKEVTGKTTTEHIAGRIIIEASELLVHTDWPVAEIAYCLGFEYAAYFNNFFKKATGITPKEARLQIV